jgi:hypothetical protein
MPNEPEDVEAIEGALAGGAGSALKRLNYGFVTLSSGRLIVVDPGTHDGHVGSVSLPPGTHPVFVLTNAMQWAYAGLVIGDAPPVMWKPAASIPVDTGTACFMSAEDSERFLAWRSLASDLMKELWVPFNVATKGPNYEHLLAPSVPPKPFHLHVDDDPLHAIPIFHAGYGDGPSGQRPRQPSSAEGRSWLLPASWHSDGPHD